MSSSPASDLDGILAAYEVAAATPRTELYPPGAIVPNAEKRTALDLFWAAPAEAPAVFYFDAMLTYADIDRMSDRLAGWLAANGVGPRDRVAIILQNTPQFLIAAIAVWKLAAIVVSLNPMYRTPELAKLFSDCAPRVILCHDEQWDVVSSAASAVVEPELMIWTSGHEFQNRNDARVLPPSRAAPAERALGPILAQSLPVPARAPVSP